ncbi:hypothetical protein CYLTODRAFT_371232 [Cylindrobasidium torrendii FP15055 ss-10]|uniref:Zn(2)-C6 fungal-type domain-containing protein n=1 Tax=Cylindrobasidium torrendii FP15055 ss-10 TaxID=1314674 RepID=A0A0D7BJL9_9AGAR|nr:hypothetical protein CYLTODRAFT_371232 [Cylindrobasidium torrendii FP15055 ss-10]
MSAESRRGLDSAAARKSALSCAECRRSKLRCDRIFPCQSCIRRGCANICPDGVLTATKGNKVIMAHAEKLAEEVKHLTSRIHELESALSQQSNGDTHPLLQPRDNHHEEVEALYETGLNEVSEAIGTLSIGKDGQARYHGETAGSEYFQELLPVTDGDATFHDHSRLDLPYELVHLVNSFPFGLKDCNYTKSIFVQYMPTQERAMYLADLYYKNSAWMYDPIIQQDFLLNVLTPIYFAPGFANIDSVHSHKLSIFFMMMADGSLHDIGEDTHLMGEQYYALAQAALSIEPLLLEVTSATVQVLFMMCRFIYNSDRRSNEARWVIHGLAARLAQTIGLHRDSSGWNLDEEEQQRRRRLFWDLYTHDSWTSIVNGRPPAIMIQHSDCKFPDDAEPYIKPSGEKEFGWHAWKYRYSASCLSISIQHVFSTRVPSYKALLDLDKKIRKFPVATHLQSPIEASEAGRSWSPDRVHAMQQYCVVCERESNLMYIHRSYFAQAISSQARNPLQHQYAPSVLATYRSACRIISSLRGLYISHPNVGDMTWFFWSGVFSSIVVLGALVVESPSCTLSHDALILLNQTIPFYEEGSRRIRPPKTMPILIKLRERANAAFTQFTSTGQNHRRMSSGDPDMPDELSVLGGVKSVINTRPSSTSPSSINSQGSGGSSQQQQQNVNYNNFDSFGGSDASSPATSHDGIPGSDNDLMQYYDNLGSTTYAMQTDPAAFGMGSASTGNMFTQAPTMDFVSPQQSQQQFDSPSSYDPSPRIAQPSMFTQAPGGGSPMDATNGAPVMNGMNGMSAAAMDTGLIMGGGGGFMSQIGQAAAPMGYAYSAAAEPTQDDIWRNFVREFGLEHV